MFTCWFIRLIVCLCLPFIFGQDDVAELADIEPIQDAPVEVDLSVNDAFRQQGNTTVGKDSLSAKIITSTTMSQIPQPFACHECADCKSESDYIHRPCNPGVSMCYKMEKRLDNITRLVRRGCSALANQCVVPDDGRIDSIEIITCCTTHKCNQAIQLRQSSFFLIILSSWIIFFLLD